VLFVDGVVPYAAFPFCYGNCCFSPHNAGEPLLIFRRFSRDTAIDDFFFDWLP